MAILLFGDVKPADDPVKDFTEEQKGHEFGFAQDFFMLFSLYVSLSCVR